ncbi:MAG: hypothetical protein ACFNPX_07165, partial [Neisseria subflava]
YNYSFFSPYAKKTKGAGVVEWLDIPDCYGFRFERLRATQRFVLRCPLLGFNSRAHFRFRVALFWLQTPPIPSDSPPLKNAHSGSKES